MPARKRRKKHDSEEVQGEGSWVITSSLRVREMRDLLEREKAGESAFLLGVEVVKKGTFEWNWVDDDGNPLPQPKSDPSVIDELSDDEVAFLGKCIKGSEEERKN